MISLLTDQRSVNDIPSGGPSHIYSEALLNILQACPGLQNLKIVPFSWVRNHPGTGIPLLVSALAAHSSLRWIHNGTVVVREDDLLEWHVSSLNKPYLPFTPKFKYDFILRTTDLYTPLLRAIEAGMCIRTLSVTNGGLIEHLVKLRLVIKELTTFRIGGLDGELIYDESEQLTPLLAEFISLHRSLDWLEINDLQHCLYLAHHWNTSLPIAQIENHAISLSLEQSVWKRGHPESMMFTCVKAEFGYEYLPDLVPLEDHISALACFQIYHPALQTIVLDFHYVYDRTEGTGEDTCYMLDLESSVSIHETYLNVHCTQYRLYRWISSKRCSLASKMQYISRLTASK